jgi:uncharacterized repeat protein (TIGR01451 family)
LPPAGLTATALSGSGWSCTLGTLTCTQSTPLSAGSSYSSITLTVNVASDAPASVTNSATVSGGNESNTANDTASDPTNINAPDLSISKSHSGNFTQGQTGATYTISVRNVGTAATSGMVTVTDTLPPAGLTATALSGSGWSCTLGTLTCTQSTPLSAGSSYSSITLTVNVASDAPASVTNSATVSGGGESNTANDTANDPTNVNPALPDLTITKTHSGNFTQGQTGASYSLTVKNVGTASTNGMVTVQDSLPAGLTATALSGSGWSCTVGTLTCTQSTPLSAGSSYSSITLTVNVASNAPASVTNSATVSGGGESNTGNDTANDPTTITNTSQTDLTITKTHVGNFTQGQYGTYTITVTNVGGKATSGSVTIVDTLPNGLTQNSLVAPGWSCHFATLTCSRTDALAAGHSYPAITLQVKAASNAPSSVVNSVSVSGGGDANSGNNTATDPTTINH